MFQEEAPTQLLQLALAGIEREPGLTCVDGMPLPPYAPRVDYRDLITIEPDKRGGRPCIRGWRITVYDVLDYLASGMSAAELLRDFPDLTRDDIRTWLAFAADRERRLVSIPPA